MKRMAVVALAFVVLGALWLSASSTLALGVKHNVPDLARPALVVVLEVASVIGTALWVTAPDGSRVKPGIVVVLASLVAAVGGWHAYGWLGLVGPIAVVLVTDMVAERWADMPTPRAEELLTSDRHEEPFTQGGARDEARALSASPRSPEDEEEQVAQLRQWAAERGSMPGRDAVKTRFECGSGKANRLREKAGRPALALAVEVS